MKTYFMKALFAGNEFCKEGKHDSLGCDESGKKLHKNNCSVYEQYQFYILTEGEPGFRKNAHMSFGSLKVSITCLVKIQQEIWSCT